MTKKAKSRLKNALIFLHERRHKMPRRFWFRDIFLVTLFWYRISEGYIVFKGKSRNKYSKINDFNFKRLTNQQADSAHGRIKDHMMMIFLSDGTLKAKDIIKCRNAEIRRYLISEYGEKRFFEEMHARIIHQDGTSKLLRLDIREFSEPMIMISVRDSTTDQLYLLRVPPDIKTCKDAIAWTFNMNTQEYNPIKES